MIGQKRGVSETINSALGNLGHQFELGPKNLKLGGLFFQIILIVTWKMISSTVNYALVLLFSIAITMKQVFKLKIRDELLENCLLFTTILLIDGSSNILNYFN